ncbi:hypothetical protein CHS0354_025475, partial [Potamilus streckersoni]
MPQNDSSIRDNDELQDHLVAKKEGLNSLCHEANALGERLRSKFTAVGDDIDQVICEN